MTDHPTTSQQRTTLTTVAIACGLLLALTGCGSSADGGSSTTTMTAPRLGSVEFRPVLSTTAAGGTCDAQSSIGAAGDNPFSGCEAGQPVTYTLGAATTFSIASARAATTGTGEWAIAPVFADGGAGVDTFNALAGQCFAKQSICPTGEVAIVVGGQVVAAPTIQTPTFEADQVQITGNFDEAGARSIAEQLMTDG